jgi:hypothetical protein
MHEQKYGPTPCAAFDCFYLLWITSLSSLHRKEEDQKKHHFCCAMQLLLRNIFMWHRHSFSSLVEY